MPDSFFARAYSSIGAGGRLFSGRTSCCELELGETCIFEVWGGVLLLGTSLLGSIVGVDNHRRENKATTAIIWKIWFSLIRERKCAHRLPVLRWLPEFIAVMVKVNQNNPTLRASVAGIEKMDDCIVVC
jgi:hypothetical protein